MSINVIFDDIENMIMGVCISPIKRTIGVYYDPDSESKEDLEYYNINFPYLFFLICYKNHSCYILADDVYIFCKNSSIKPDSKLKLLPVPNIMEGGLICMNPVRVPKENLAKAVFSEFLSTPFNCAELDDYEIERIKAVKSFKKWSKKKNPLKIKWPNNPWDCYSKKLTPLYLKEFIINQRRSLS